MLDIYHFILTQKTVFFTQTILELAAKTSENFNSNQVKNLKWFNGYVLTKIEVSWLVVFFIYIRSM
jgi:hypothetical protein